MRGADGKYACTADVFAEVVAGLDELAYVTDKPPALEQDGVLFCLERFG